MDNYEQKKAKAKAVCMGEVYANRAYVRLCFARKRAAEKDCGRAICWYFLEKQMPPANLRSVFSVAAAQQTSIEMYAIYLYLSSDNRICYGQPVQMTEHGTVFIHPCTKPESLQSFVEVSISRVLKMPDWACQEMMDAIEKGERRAKEKARETKTAISVQNANVFKTEVNQKNTELKQEQINDASWNVQPSSLPSEIKPISLEERWRLIHKNIFRCNEMKLRELIDGAGTSDYGWLHAPDRSSSWSLVHHIAYHHIRPQECMSHSQLFDMLVSYGADLMVRTTTAATNFASGCAPLHIAVKTRNLPALCALLVRLPVDQLSMKDDTGATIYDYMEYRSCSKEGMALRYVIHHGGQMMPPDAAIPQKHSELKCD